MNYRHIYHAGNFADVMKHLAFVLCVEYLKKKDTPFCVIDAHGGCGLYDLSSEQAQKTGEWRDGIGRFDRAAGQPDSFLFYDHLIRPDLDRQCYPGSPVLAARMLRPSDRLIANELHPEDVVTLRRNLRSFENAYVTHLDAYECIRAHVPPPEKRGIVLIDPPFEERDEFDTLARQMAEWKKRWPTGIYMIWYPIKAHLDIPRMMDAARAAGFHRTWHFECLRHPRMQPETFNGSGLLIFNVPFSVPETLRAAAPFLSERLDLHEVRMEWLTSE
jgi:23S rRNA (adenine2030-N6)-methyltransferase